MPAKRLFIAVVAALAFAGCRDYVRTLAESQSAKSRRQAAGKIGQKRNPADTPHLIAALEDPDESVRAKVAWALGQIATTEAIDALSRALGDPFGLVRSEAALGLSRGGTAVAGRLVKALADPEPVVRASAAKALGEVKGPVASLGLRQAVVDSDPRVRAAAVEALSEAEGEAAAAELQAALSDESSRVRLAAAKALAARPDRSSVATLTRALEDEAAGVALFAARALVRMPAREAAPGLVRVAGTFGGELRDAALKALGRTPGDRAQSALVEFLGHWDPAMRSRAARALASGLHPGSQDALVEALSDYDEEARREAAYSLAAYKRGEGVPILIEDLRAGPRRAKAIDSLAEIGPPAAKALCGLLAASGTTPEAATAAMIVLAEIGSQEDVEDFTGVIVPALESPHPEMRAVAAMAIGRIGAGEALGRIRALAYDRDRRVRMAAVYAAALLGDEPQLDELGVALREGSEPTRWMAAELLAELPGPRASELLARGLEAPQGTVRTLSAMGLGRKGASDAAIVAALAARAADVDGRVRIATAEALGRIGTPGSARALRPFVRDRESSVRVAACLALAGASRREGVPVAAKALVDPSPEVRRAALTALQQLSGEHFGLKPDRVPSDDEFDSAVRRAQIWWNEHERDYGPHAVP